MFDPFASSIHESGVWTPVIQSSGTNFTSVTYAVQNGTYVRINNIVFFRCYVNWSATTGTPTGTLRLNGLPYNSASGANNIGTCAVDFSNIVFPGAQTQLVAESLANGSSYDFYACGGGSAAAVVAASNGGVAGRYLILSGFYFV